MRRASARNQVGKLVISHQINYVKHAIATTRSLLAGKKLEVDLYANG